VKTPEELVERIVKAIDSRRAQLTYPAFYRIFGILQAVAPSLLSRLGRSGYRSS
jgi:hypothetical protein